jgi:hypothetical protein
MPAEAEEKDIELKHKKQEFAKYIEEFKAKAVYRLSLGSLSPVHASATVPKGGTPTVSPTPRPYLSRLMPVIRPQLSGLIATYRQLIQIARIKKQANERLDHVTNNFQDRQHLGRLEKKLSSLLKLSQDAARAAAAAATVANEAFPPWERRQGR